MTKMRMTNPEIGRLSRNIEHAATLGLSMVQPGCHNDAPGAVICGTGPTLLEPENLAKIRELADQGYIVFAAKEAVSLLDDAGIKVHYTAAMDPGERQIAKTPIVKGVTYCLASSCSPAMFKHCMKAGVQVLIFHSACGAPREIELYGKLFGDTTIAEGGYTVINRTYALARIMGIKKNLFIAGAPFGWRTGQSYYAPGVAGKPGNEGPAFTDKGAVDGREWQTRLDLMTSAQDLALRAKAGEVQFIGDSLAASLAKHPEEFIRGVSSKEVVNAGPPPGTRKVGFDIDPETGDLEMYVVRLTKHGFKLDPETGDIELLPPEWVREAPHKQKGNDDAGPQAKAA